MSATSFLTPFYFLDSPKSKAVRSRVQVLKLKETFHCRTLPALHTISQLISNSSLWGQLSCSWTSCQIILLAISKIARSTWNLHNCNFLTSLDNSQIPRSTAAQTTKEAPTSKLRKTKRTSRLCLKIYSHYKLRVYTRSIQIYLRYRRLVAISLIKIRPKIN